MKRMIVWTVILAALLPISSASAVGLTLNWGGCIGDGAGAAETFFCAESALAHRLVFEIQPPTVSAFYAVDMTVDLQLEDQALSPFWHMEDMGCNHAGLEYTLDRSAHPHTGCLPEFSGTTGASASPFMFYGSGYPSANRARILLSALRSAAAPITLYEGSNYYFGHLIFGMSQATEAGGSCSGCTTPASLVWTSALLRHQQGSGGSVEVTGPGIGTSCVTVNGGGTGPCAFTAARNRTWGQIKSMYR